MYDSDYLYLHKKARRQVLAGFVPSKPRVYVKPVQI